MKPWEKDRDSVEVDSGESGPWDKHTEDDVEPQEPTFGERVKADWENIGEAAANNEKTPTEIEKGASVLGRSAAFLGNLPIQALGAVAKTVFPGRSVEFKGELPKNQVGLLPNLSVKTPDVEKIAREHPRAATLAESALEIGGAIPGLGKVVAPLTRKISSEMGSALQGGAGRIQGTKVKVNMPEFKKGAQNEMYVKHDVFGNADKVQAQWQGKIDDTYGQLKTKIESAANDPENYASIDDIFSAAEKSAETYGKSKTSKAAIIRQLQSLKSEFEAAYPDGYINILDAQAEKQFIGKKGDWLSRAGEISGNPEASLNAQAHNALYDALKINVENKGGPEIKGLNNQLSEFIPMERAAAKQKLISNRKNLISLDDYLGGLHAVTAAAAGNYVPATIVAANMASKSPTIASGLNRVGKGLSAAANKEIHPIRFLKSKLPKKKQPTSLTPYIYRGEWK